MITLVKSKFLGSPISSFPYFLFSFPPAFFIFSNDPQVEELLPVISIPQRTSLCMDNKVYWISKVMFLHHMQQSMLLKAANRTAQTKYHFIDVKIINSNSQ